MSSFGVWTEQGRRAAKAGRPRPSVRWAGSGRIRGGGVCLERGLDGKEEGRVGRGGEVRGGEACMVEHWALQCHEVGVRRLEG